TNQIYAIAVDSNNVATTSSSIYIIKEAIISGLTNKTLKITLPCSGSTDSHLAYCTDANYYLGAGTENEGATITTTSVQSDTTDQTIKIFMTTPDADLNQAEDELDDDEFLDKISPSFGFGHEKGDYLLRTALRYTDLVLSGTKIAESGKYAITIKNNGLTSTGKTNITIQIS
ncbi:hypothetical protein HON01_04105, partial [Candidatus Woesearchaeota archaeon]|nr:hypothetical protein [Candidatus Woesearchaeota archaeon]